MAAKKSKSKKAARPREGRANRSLRERGIPEPWEYAWGEELGVACAIVDPLPRLGWKWEDGNPPTIEVPVRDRRGFWVPIRVPDCDGAFAVEALSVRSGFASEHLVIAAASWFLANLRDPIGKDWVGLDRLRRFVALPAVMDFEASEGTTHAEARRLLWPSAGARDAAEPSVPKTISAANAGALTLALVALLGRNEVAEQQLAALRDRARRLDREMLIVESLGAAQSWPRMRPPGRRKGAFDPREQLMFEVMTRSPGTKFTLLQLEQHELLRKEAKDKKDGQRAKRLFEETQLRPWHGWRICRVEAESLNRRGFLYWAERVQ